MALADSDPKVRLAAVAHWIKIVEYITMSPFASHSDYTDTRERFIEELRIMSERPADKPEPNGKGMNRVERNVTDWNSDRPDGRED
jgi:hypothetical protein